MKKACWMAAVLTAVSGLAWGQGPEAGSPAAQQPPPADRRGERMAGAGRGMQGWGMEGGGLQGAGMPGRAMMMDAMIVERLANSPELAQKVGLSAEQTDKIKKLSAETREQMAKLNPAREQAALKQAELISAPKPDEAAVMKAVDETATIWTQIAKLQVHQLLAAKQVLTPEQSEQVKTLVREKMKDRREEMTNNVRRGGAGANRKTPPPPAPPAPPQPGQ